MYHLKVDGQVIAKSAGGDIAFQSGTLLERVGAAGVLTCVLLPENPYFGYIALRSNVLTLERDGTEIFRGQAVAKRLNDSGFFELSGLGDMSYLRDVQIAPFTYTGTLSNTFGEILSKYNASASTWRRIYKGTVGITGTVVYELNSYRSAWDCVSDLLRAYGGVLEMRWLADGTRGIDWKTDSGRFARQPALWGDNLLSLEIENDASNVVNTLVCEGDNNIILTAQSNSSRSKYGKIYGYKRFNGVADPYDLIAAGQAAVALAMKEARTVTGSAIDKWKVGMKDFAPFRPGDFVRAQSRQHLLDEWLVCSELRHDLTEAKPVQVTLGRIGDSLTDSTQTGVINRWIIGTQGTVPAYVKAKDATNNYAKSSGDYAVALEG